jgi:2'-5' RNA ligase
MRLFIALDIDDVIRERIARFVDGVREFAADARWMRPESLHVTLKFIGERPDDALAEIKRSLSTIEASAIEVGFRGYGFFPSAKWPRVFWIGITAGTGVSHLAGAVEEKLSSLGIEKEAHAYSPHLTLARGPGGSGAARQRSQDRPNRAFARLQEKLTARPEPEFGTMTARGFYLYQSQLSPKGSKYTKLAAFGLK